MSDPMDFVLENHKRDKILAKIVTERLRQEHLCASGKFPWTCATTLHSVSRSDKLAVLAEEFGEVSKEIVEGIIKGYDTDRMRNIHVELVQVAACCVAWLESLDDDGRDL